MGTTTPNIGLTKPTPGDPADRNLWGGYVNVNFDTLDAIFKSDGTGTSVGVNIGAGKTMKVAGTMTLTGTISGTGTLDVGTAQFFTGGTAPKVIIGPNASFPNVPSVSMSGTLSDTLMRGFFADANHFYINSSGDIVLRPSGTASPGYNFLYRLSSTSLSISSAVSLKWYSNGTGGAADTGLSRSAAGVVEVNTGTPGTLASITHKTEAPGDSSTKGATTAFLTAAAAFAVADLAALKALPIRPNAVVVQTGRAAGVWQWVAADATTADDSLVVQCTSGTAGRYKRVYDGPVNVKWFGAAGDGSTDDSAAISAAFTAAATLGRALYIPGTPNFYRCASQLYFNLGATTSLANLGIVVRGDGWRRTIIQFDNTVASPNMKIGASGATTGAFYAIFQDFGVVGTVAGTVLQFGDTSFSDALNSCRFNLNVINASTSASAVAVEINFVLQSEFDLIANCSGHGTAIRIRQMQGCKVFGGAGNADVGVYMTAGSSYANDFGPLDLEVLTSTGLKIDSGNVFGNTFTGPWMSQMAYAVDASAGFNNVIQGGSASAITTSFFNGSNYVGIIRRDPQVSLVTTPTLPATGVSFTNPYGEVVQVSLFGGPITSVTVGGVAVAPPTFTVNPGDAVVVSYTGGTSWTWRAMK